MWIGVILSAVVLGLAVVYLLNSWMPQSILGWVLFVAAGFIALRSVARIVQLAKQAGESSNEDK